MKKRLFPISIAVLAGLTLALLYVLSGATLATLPTAHAQGLPCPAQRPLLQGGNVITVCLSGGCDHTTIQDAVDAASDHDVIKVASGMYTDIHARAGITQVAYINKSRKRYKAQQVKLDILASRVANRMCREACENNFRGHWNMRGEKPYHRYALAGGLDHVAENASAKWSSREFDKNLAIYADFMKQAHDRFMAEKAPRDGHKRNCIRKQHNFVGLGTYLYKNQFRYYEEFIDHTSPADAHAVELMYDPQTSGGLLIALGGDELGVFESAMSRAGERFWVVGRVVPEGPHALVLI